jgi:hypothetical protein
VLTTAHHLLQARAARIGDEAMRRSFLEKVAERFEVFAGGLHLIQVEHLVFQVEVQMVC